MAERPILFSGPMVRAILAGTKTQTRRVVKPQPQPNGGEGFHPVRPYACPDGRWNWVLAATGMGGDPFQSPYGVPGDLLWVRETWARVGSLDPGWLVYRATYPNDLPANVENVPPADAVTWRPSIHMRRTDSRITLRVTSVRVERLQAISEADAEAEGVEPQIMHATFGYSTPTSRRNSNDYTRGFVALWDSINAERAPWSSNPWVWVVGFERVLSGNS